MACSICGFLSQTAAEESPRILIIWGVEVIDGQFCSVGLALE